MGAGILPTTIRDNKLCFLFGKENKYADTPGWSDIGGGKDNHESFLETAYREGMEETTGFLGMEKDIKRLLSRHGTYNIDFQGKGSHYRIHIFPMIYDPQLPQYYNNNHRFLERKLSPSMIKNAKIFEKDELKWFSIDEMKRRRNEFRCYYGSIIDQILDQQSKIRAFVRRGLVRERRANKTRKAKTKTKTSSRSKSKSRKRRGNKTRKQSK